MGDQSKAIEIIVNEKRVKVFSDRLTGKDIKQAVVDHGVIVDLEFVLSIEEDGKHRIIREEEDVTVGSDTRIIAVPNDDYSSEGPS